MPALNFQRCFADDVRTGKKKQTIRPQRKRGSIFEGCRLALYTGMRTKKCEKLKETICTGTMPITIDGGLVYLYAAALTDKMIDELAEKDGFKNKDEFFKFFRKRYGFPFHGILINWL